MTHLVASFVGIVLIVGIIFAFRSAPAADAATNPGLDSGNATVTTVGSDTVLTYKTTGTSTFKAPAGVTNVRVMVIGGGGSGGTDNAGGGGAGGFIENTSFAVTPGAATTVTVGAGGTAVAAPGSGRGGNGGNSVFGSLTAIGGGGGGYHGGNSGNNGGSGGGAGGNAVASGGTGTSGQGNNGGSKTVATTEGRNAGGGGAGGAGSNATTTAPGPGGAGKTSDITGTSIMYAGGGGGAGRNDTGNVVPGANGGSGGGGRGAGSNGVAGAGSANTGSGGGGGANNPSNSSDPVRSGAAGGSGIVVVRFTTQNKPDLLGMTGLRMWYKADGAGNTNALWKDSSGLGYDITQGTGSKQPALTQGAVNFNPAYVFDGTDDTFSMPTHGIIGTDPMTAFYGASASRTDGGYRYFEEFGDDTPSISMNNGKPDLYVRGTSPLQLTFATPEALVPHIYSFVSPNANNQPRIVGVDNREQSQNVTTGVYATTSGGQAGNMFGGTNGSSGTSWAGPMAEAIYFNRVLTAQERQRVNSYLAIKYGTTLGTGATAYLDSSGAQVYPADATYKNNIAGIGRDDTMTLNQKQSKSTAAGDIVTMGNGGTIATTNQGNVNNFTADKSFLMWGHDGAATSQSTTVNGAYIRMNRIWKAVKTNAVGQVKIQIPTSAVAALSGNSGILYTSSSPTFDAGAARTAMTVNGSNYEATVTLAAGTSYFTFGSMAGSDIQFVSKTATSIGGDPITAYTPGESMNYVLKVKNNGPDNAGTITVTDTLPAGLVPVSGTGGGWACPNISGQTVTCTRSALNTGNTAPDLIIEVQIASSITGSKANTATAAVSNDPDPSNNSASLTLNAAPKADLSIAKGHTGLPTAGNPHTYSFTVTNNGPSDVSSFTVTDTLDSNLTYVSATGATCNAAAQVVTCTGGALTANGAGRTTTFTMTVNVSPSYAGGIIENTSTVSTPAGTTDPNSGNNSSTDRSNVTVDTQLGITKTHTGNFTAGENNTFTLTIDNQGPSNAPTGSVTVTDTLDEDFTYVSAIGTGWSCNENTGTVTCSNTAPINAGDTPTITLTVLVDPIAKGSTTNTAEVSSTTPDSDLSDNSSDNPVTIVSEADLGITKAHVGTTFVAGQQEQYTFTVVNNGPSADSPSYQITDTLPASLSFVSATGDATCTNVGQAVTCNGGAIGVGQAQTTTMTVAVSGSATGTIANTASITPATGVTDPVSGNNTSNDNVNVEPNADLTVVSKTPSTDMTAGAAAAYVVKVHNNGPSNVSSFKVTDTLDSNLTFQTSTGCSVTSTLGDGRQVVECTGGAVNSGQDAADITINVLVEATVTPGSTISNTATVTPPAGTNDPDATNNSGSVDRNIVASADLAVTKSHTGNFTAGANNTYTVVVTNNGPSDASAFTVTDTLPTGLTFVSGNSTAGVSASCANAGQIVTCTGGPAISSGQSSTITLTVAVAGNIAGNTTLDNTASVASATPDPNTGNNTSAVDTVTVDSVADLEIQKVHVSDFTAGNPERYSFDVINHGSSDVTGFTVTDTLPAGLTYNSSDLNGSDVCAGSSGQNVTCNGPAITAGQSVTFTVTVNTSGSLVAGNTVSNTANVATIAPTTDNNMANNSSTDVATVVNVTDLSIVKTHTGTFTAGENAAYTMTVSNSGPSNTPTNDVSVVDILPAGMTYISAGSGGTGWTCSASNGTVTCDYAPALAVNGTTPTLTINVAIGPDKQGEVSNTATVVSLLDDSDPADDDSTDTTTIGAEANLTATKVPQGTLVAGQPVTYRFSVTNNGGPSVANGVVISDPLQDHYTYESFSSVSGGTWDCSEASGTVTCGLSTPLAVGGTAVVDVTLIVAENAPNPLANTAAVTFNGTDPTPANPTTSDPVSYSADLEVKLSHKSETYRAGDTVDFTYTVINHGPSTAEDVVLTDTLPNGLSFESIVANNYTYNDPLVAKVIDTLLGSTPVSAAPNTPFSCSNTGQNVTCNAATLAVGTYTIHMTARIANNFTGDLTSVLAISSTTPDPNPSNNTSSDTIQNILAALGLAKTGQDILTWGVTAIVLIGVPTVLAVRRYRTRAIKNLM